MSASADSTPSIVIDVSDPDAMQLWRTVVKIADALAGDETRWCLVGGLMVALFAIEAGQLPRRRPGDSRPSRYRAEVRP